MLVMAKPKKNDRHRQPMFALRLPAAVRELVRKMAADEDRTITAVVKRAAPVLR